ncbi:hypothetical protein C5E07_11575 [Pseudoclavibacter sp. RFBJ3]|uniref:sulfite exporter TauE/SafE family protein n=1 Tax=unclassified Pseudoclavibacter TaxID=2615177 RepID=UPI000CE88949|nr:MULTISPECIES: sulfite exporter TauE/SafE family protein [unclassified Pseudoclavibacter]PPF83029.1 hypothetical protein C5C12_10650 [Pseudoclavibacter sp. RFBJ5]PPF91728.1 hypothetical protein C5E07_11575 [Pseudoclavibacter sp. RFBJ3]PPF95545.1 hypothetical protein C5C19_17535 [Pseudoclavibacter sp. RFBH5]PPG19588.1 hypothetical protein C5E13_15875 [Pseudoclavibacter sp. RFBI4]
MLELLPQLPTFAWVLLAVAAFAVGVSKTALPGVTTLSVATFAAVLPAKQSTGALLVLLIVGDMFALWTYRRHADWPTLVKLIPAVAVGLLAGAAFLAFADDSWVRRVIGIILLILVTITVWRRYRTPETPSDRAAKVARAGYGSLGGFTTMVANAGGPVMAMYFFAAKFPVKAFLGTAAWFFAIVNIAKLPFSVGLGLITPGTLVLDLLLVPLLIGGAFLGRWLAPRLSQKVFDRIVLVLTVAGAVYLLV